MVPYGPEEYGPYLVARISHLRAMSVHYRCVYNVFMGYMLLAKHWIPIMPIGFAIYDWYFFLRGTFRMFLNEDFKELPIHIQSRQW